MNSVNNFSHLKGYASYLKEHKLKELALSSCYLAKNLNLQTPFKSEKELIDFLTTSFEHFLKDIAEKDPIGNTLDTLMTAKTLPVYYEMSHRDIVLAYNIRKKVLNDFISDYTADHLLQQEVSKEINILLLIIQKTATQFSKV
jgi:hypothetical protein